MENCKQHKRDRSLMQGKGIEEVFTEDEITTLQLLEIMQQEKDPHKWHENLFCNKRCKQSQEFVERSSPSPSTTIMEEDGNNAEALVSLVTMYQAEEKCTSLIYNPSDLPPLESIRDCILEYGKPLEKQLKKSDVNTNLNRLLLNKKHVENIFLPLLKNDENIKEGIQACVYDMHGNNYSMTFKKWTEKYYVLTAKWNEFFKIHKLQQDDFITVWIFRHSISNRLCFALAYRKRSEESHDIKLD